MEEQIHAQTHLIQTHLIAFNALYLQNCYVRNAVVYTEAGPLCSCQSAGGCPDATRTCAIAALLLDPALGSHAAAVPFFVCTVANARCTWL
jgi:hypothetical protein